MKRTFFFTGKGGVGKTTISSMFAVFFAKRGFRTLLVSLDPAHNLFDVFKTKPSKEPTQVLENLYIYEADPEKYKRQFLSNVKEELERSFRYLTAFNLEHYFKTIEKSPVLIEQSMATAFEYLTERRYNLFVFDMPPSALSYRFFSLPENSLVWLENLISLRKKINDKREIIIRIKKESLEDDPVIKKLSNLKERYKRLKEKFENATIYIVKNPDRISTVEAERVKEWLKELKLNVKILENRGKDILEMAAEIHTGKLPPEVESAFSSLFSP
ncbi:ArsA family ATPase [Desulfurobacterium sp.]|uniref:ArsA family ATPase n=1 Tax=Desulfurobacterium sp. TaxID=2004706 RepID=UPI0026278DF3|nr:ArsA family ATPase [Desulfurobacterium sp.]